MTAAPPRRPAPPAATRLHRGALGIVAALVAVTAAVGVHYLAATDRPTAGGESADSLAGSTPPPRQQPAFPDPPDIAPATAPATAPAAAPATQRSVAPGSGADADPMPRRVSRASRRDPSRDTTRETRQSPLTRAQRAGLLVAAASAAPDTLPSPYALAAGTILSAVLVTEVNSDLPGPIVAQLAHDVYDSRTQQRRLLPAGTRLIGRYDSHLVAGQGRLLVVWTRLILPDAEEIPVADLPAIDAHGAAGIADAVDNHLGRVVGTAALMSAVGAAAQLSQPTTGGAFAAPTAGSIAAGAVGQQLTGAGLELLRRNADIPPTITARAGLAVGVLLGRTLVLPGPYRDSRS